MANDDVIERAEQLLLEPIVNRMAAGERACQLVIDLVVELRASRARVAVLLEKASEANDELSGATGLTPGDQIKIDSALTIIDAAMGEAKGE